MYNLEDWFRTNPTRFFSLMASPTFTLAEAWRDGVRQSTDPSMNEDLNDPAVVRLGEFMAQPWFESARKALRTDPEAAYDIMVANGMTSAPCCNGENEECEFQQGLNAAIVRLEHKSH